MPEISKCCWCDIFTLFLLIVRGKRGTTSHSSYSLYTVMYINIYDQPVHPSDSQHRGAHKKGADEISTMTTRTAAPAMAAAPQGTSQGPILIDTQHDNMVHDAQLDYYGCKLATSSSGKRYHVFNACLSLLFTLTYSHFSSRSHNQDLQCSRIVS